MIRRRTKRLWAGVFLVASASLVATGVALPVLDGDLYAIGALIEPEHDAGTCAVAHNHALCMVWAGSKLVPVVGYSTPPTSPGVVRTAAEAPEVLPSAAERLTARSRAPPTL